MMKKIIVLTALILISVSFGVSQGPSTDLEMELMYAEPVPLQSGEYADLWIRVTNTGDITAENPRFEIKDNYPFTPTEKKEYRVGRGGLEPGQHRDIRVQVKVNENAVFGNNTLEIRSTSGNQDIWIEEKIPLEVRTDEKSLIVSSLDFPKRVQPGGSAKMNITLENLANSKFQNIDISLDTSNVPVSAAETSRRRISGIEPGNSEEVSFTLEVGPDAENELHDLPIEIDYEDQAGNSLEMSETTGVNIGGFPNIDVAVEESDIRTSGKGDMTLRIINKGEGEARFTEIEVQESKNYEVLSENSIYLGSMIADDFQTAEFGMYVENGEKLEIPVNVRYRDGNGDQQETINVERELYSNEELNRYGLSENNFPILIILLLIGVLGAGALYWRRRKG